MAASKKGNSIKKRSTTRVYKSIREIKAHEKSCEERYMILDAKGDLTEEESYDRSRCYDLLVVLAYVEATHIENLEEIVKEAVANRDLLPPVREIT